MVPEGSRLPEGRERDGHSESVIVVISPTAAPDRASRLGCLGLTPVLRRRLTERITLVYGASGKLMLDLAPRPLASRSADEVRGMGTDVPGGHPAVATARRYAPSRPSERAADLPSAEHDEVDDSTIVCVLTRFALRRPWHLLQTYLAYRWLLHRMRRKDQGGLLKSTFLVESLTTCYSLSIWSDESAIPRFGTSVEEHVAVARDVFGRLRFRNRRPEIWSTRWRLAEISNNLNWDAFDLRHAIGVAPRGTQA